MPCTYEESEEEKQAYRERQAQEAEAYKRQKRELDNVTRLLCQIIKETGVEAIGRSSEMRDWWFGHQEMDKKRRAREEKARKAKLTALQKQKEELREKEMNELKRLQKKYGKDVK